MLLTLLTIIGLASASELPLPDSLAALALSETRPRGRTAFPLQEADYVLEWTGDGLPDVTLRILPDTIDWTRTADVLVVPTARLEIVATGVSSGTAQAAGFQQPLVVSDGIGRGELPIALLTGAFNPVRIAVERDGVVQSQTAVLRSTRQGLPLIARDTSCSQPKLKWSAHGEFSGDWVYLGCRLSSVKGEGRRTESLELYALWDGAAALRVGGNIAGPSLTNTWTFRLRHQPATLRLEDLDGDTLDVSYEIRRRAHHGVIGLTLGPAYSDGPAALVRPHIMLKLDDRAFAVLFDAFLQGPDGYINDIGGYYSRELVALADDRLRISTLLGAHMQTFDPSLPGDVDEALSKFATNVSRISLPQGLDLFVPDAGARSWWLRVGGFAQPKFSESWYYQAYLRFGPRSYVEVNYTAWNQPEMQHERVSLMFGGQLFPVL